MKRKMMTSLVGICVVAVALIVADLINYARSVDPSVRVATSIATPTTV